MITLFSDLQEAFTVFQTKVHLKSSITLSVMKSRKEKVILQIHISTDEQISRHFGKASIQDERVCILKLELVETTSFLLKKEEMTLQVRKEHWKYYWSIYSWKIVQIGQILSYSESGLRFLMDSDFPLWLTWEVVSLLMYHR